MSKRIEPDLTTVLLHMKIGLLLNTIVAITALIAGVYALVESTYQTQTQTQMQLDTLINKTNTLEVRVQALQTGKKL